MKGIIQLSLFAAILLFQACSLNECGECFTPPSPFFFEIVDKHSGENLFTNGTFLAEEIVVLNNENNSTEEFSFISENSLNIIQIHSIGWQTEEVTLSVQVADSSIFLLYVDAKRISEDCCTYTKYNEIRIENTDYELDMETEIYSILID